MSGDFALDEGVAEKLQHLVNRGLPAFETFLDSMDKEEEYNMSDPCGCILHEYVERTLELDVDPLDVRIHFDRIRYTGSTEIVEVFFDADSLWMDSLQRYLVNTCSWWNVKGIQEKTRLLRLNGWIK